MDNRAALGPVILDLKGHELLKDEHELLRHKQCGGVILFARNYDNVEQVTRLTQAIKAVRPELLIYVDQEGGRVQRMRDGFLNLPPLASLGVLYEREPLAAIQRAEQLGWLMASECLAVGVDVSFAPVLDLNYENSEVIGDRALHAQADVVAALASAYVDGMHQAGMAAVGKHYPGHGYVNADSHHELPIDSREYEQIHAMDLKPFVALVKHGIDGLMPAHIIYEQCAPEPAGFSSFWVQQILRMKIGFDGVVFSDDLTMEGAARAGASIIDRADAALGAGCDVVLVCNDQNKAQNALDGLAEFAMPAASQRRLNKMRGTGNLTWRDLHNSAAWLECVAACERSEIL